MAEHFAEAQSLQQTQFGQSPYNRRSQVDSYCINKDQFAKPAVVDSVELSRYPNRSLYCFTDPKKAV